MNLALTLSLFAATQWPSLSTELPRAGGGENDVAVVVGASDYVFLPDVDGATTNADDWFQWLARVRGVPLDRLVILKDREVTRERLERAVTTAAASAKPNGIAWFIFIGHGAPAPGGDDGVLLGVDTQPDLESLGARGVTQSFVAKTLATGKHRESVVVFDACFSGRAPDGEAPLVPGMQATVPVRRVAAPASKGPATTLLSASETFAGPLPGAKRPAFSYALLGALRGWGDDNGDKNITVDEAYRSARSTLQIAFKSDERLPKKSGSSKGDAVLAKNATEKAPDLVPILMGRSTPQSAPPVVASVPAAAAPMPTTIPELAAAVDKAINSNAPVDTQLELHARLGRAVLLQGRTAYKQGDEVTGDASQLRAERNFLRALELWPQSSKRGVVEEMAAMSDFHLAEIEMPRLFKKAPLSDDIETMKEQMRQMDFLIRPIVARLDRVATGYASNVWSVQGFFGKGALFEMAVKIYGAAPCSRQMNSAQCAAWKKNLEGIKAQLQAAALAEYERAVEKSEQLGQNSEEARFARMSVARLKAK